MRCVVCGNVLIKGQERTCSIKCRNAFLSQWAKANNQRPPSRKGTKLTTEHREKIRAVSNQPNRRTSFRNRAYQRLRLQEALVARKRKYDRIGRRGRERDMIKKRPEYIAWRKAVFMRDNYTCQMCGERGGELQADHVKPFAYFPKLRFSLSNGRTLCKTCHRKTPTYGSRAITLYGKRS